jgi:hypothetical protein
MDFAWPDHALADGPKLKPSPLDLQGGIEEAERLLGYRVIITGEGGSQELQA